MSLKYLSRVSALTVLAIGIAACNSSGNISFSNPSTNLPPVTEQTEAEKAEAERLENIETNRVALLEKAKKAGLSDKQATAYAEANKESNDKVAQAALETLVAEKAAADKAAAEKAAAEKAEKERLQKIEANRLILLDKAKKSGLSDKQAAAYAEANKESNDKVAQAALETLVAEKAAAEKAAAEKAAAEKAAAEKAAAEKAAAEKAEKERLQKIEANRLILLDKAKKSGLSAQQAAAYAEANKQATDKVAQTALETLVAEKAAAEKAAAEKAEKERLQKIEANRLVLLDKAKKAGLSAQQAAAYAEANKQATDKVAQTALETLVAEKAAAEKAAAEKAEKERLQKIEANRLVLLDKAKKAGLSDKQATAYAEANKESNDKVAQAALETLVAEKAAADKAAAEKAAAEKAEKERLQKIEANRLILLDKAKKAGLSDKQATAYAEANKESNDKVAQAALETLVAEKAAADKAAAEKAAAEKAEKERLQKIEANRLALLDKAKKAGLTDQQAADYAEANKQASETNAQNALDSIVAENERVALDNALYQAKGDYHNNPQYPVNQISAKTTSRSSSTINGAGSYAQSHEVVYNQPYSVVLGSYSSQAQTNRNGFITSQSMTPNITIKGLLTEANAIPTLGTATYSGKAFISEKNPLLSSTSGLYEEGSLSYNVNFSDRTGSGSITGLGDTVELQQGSISGTGISAVAQQGYRDGSYLLDFFGKKAEEIAGKVIFDGKDTIGFGGTRGEISKK